MAYAHLQLDHISDSRIRRCFHHASLYLADLYSIFSVDSKIVGGGAGNFSIALILLCVIDGVARDIYPTIMQVKDHETRFKRLIRCKLPWQPGWIDVASAARVMYLEIRNTLTHELAGDKVTAARPTGFDEPAIHKWAPGRSLSVDELDKLENWPNDWPILQVGPNAAGQLRHELSDAALYWAVKRMLTLLSLDSELLASAARQT